MKHTRLLSSVSLYSGIVMLAMVLILTNLNYHIMEKEAIKALSKGNETLLNELSYRIRTINKTNIILCNTLQSDSEVQQILFAKGELDSFQQVLVVNKMHSAIASNDSVQSMYLYNGIVDKRLSTDALLSRVDTEIDTLLKTNKDSSNLLFIPRAIEFQQINETQKLYLLSYILANRDKDNNIENALVLNVDLSKFFSDNFGSNPYSNLILLFNGEPIFSTNETLANIDFKGILSSEEELTTQTIKIDGEDILLSAIDTLSPGWKLINFQKYSEIFAMVGVIRVKFIFLSLVLIIMSIIATLVFAYLFDKPFFVLLDKIKNNDGKSATSRKRNLNLIENILDQQEQTILENRQYLQSTNEILKKDKLKDFLLGNTQYDTNKDEEICNTFTKNEAVLLCLLKIYSHDIPIDPEMRSLQKNQIIVLILQQLKDLSQKFEIVQISKQEFILIFKEIDNAKSLMLTSKTIENINNLLNIHSIGLYTYERYCASDIQNAIGELRTSSQYSLYYGFDCLLDLKSLDEKLNSSTTYPISIENNIMKGLIKSDMEYVNDRIIEFVEYFNDSSIKRILFCINKLCFSIQIQLTKFDNYRTNKITMDYAHYFKEISESETKENLIDNFLTLFLKLNEILNVSCNANVELIDKVIKYLEENYMNKDICLKEIAYTFNLTTTYLGGIFKHSCGKSVKEYINTLKLNEAQDMVKETSLQINEIIEICGFETSSFYRLYKKQFGISPNEQRRHVER
jgi:AraC-like DNA-binding protein